MFLLDSLMISGISWALKTVVTAAEAEMNDDTALREQLLEAEMQREMGEITDDDFAEIERDLLGRIREIKERREGGSGPLAFGEGEPIESTADSRFQIEASVSGDFHDPAEAPHTTIVEESRRGAASSAPRAARPSACSTSSASMSRRSKNRPYRFPARRERRERERLERPERVERLEQSERHPVGRKIR